MMEQQPQQPQQQHEQHPLVHQSPKNMWVSKLVLRTISSIFDLILIGSSATLRMSWYNPAVVLFIPPASVSLIWNVAEGISILVRGGHRGIHPGACVGVDLILWLSFSVCTVIYLLYGWGRYLFTYYDIFSRIDSSHFGLSRACLIIGFLQVIVHFALFVMACVETSKRNSASKVIVYQSPPSMMYGPGYAPQPMAFQPGQYNQHPHHSMAVPATYQPNLQGYPAYGASPQQALSGEPGKLEVDSTPVAIPSPSYDGHNERRP